MKQRASLVRALTNESLPTGPAVANGFSMYIHPALGDRPHPEPVIEEALQRVRQDQEDEAQRIGFTRES